MAILFELILVSSEKTRCTLYFLVLSGICRILLNCAFTGCLANQRFKEVKKSSGKCVLPEKYLGKIGELD